MKEVALLLDIGTTTIKGLLLDKARGKEIISGLMLNGQVEFGEDIISRMDFSLKASGNGKILRNAALKSVNALIANLSKNSSIKASSIKEAVVVCNTAMHHLFLGLSVKLLIKPPYKALQKAELTIKAKAAGLKICPEADVTFLPNIGGFVGSDAVAFIIASGIYKTNSIKLAIDLGTNGEILLGNKDKILVTSTAAGPAFEGRHITCGMSAQEGAIDKVKIANNGSVKISVTGNTSPKGICGSGLIDAIAQMLKCGIMDNTGRMRQNEFVLYKKGNKKIYITQSDVRKVQLAKAAIYAGIKVLMRQLNIEADSLSEILITGSFGNSINAQNSIYAGIIPCVSESRVRFVKDAPLLGAEKYISSKQIRSGLTSILSKTKRIPLIRRDFMETYAESMRFVA